MGTLPDGRQVKRVVVERGILQSDHFVYFVDRADTTVNYEEKSGKTSYLRSQAYIEHMQRVSEGVAETWANTDMK